MNKNIIQKDILKIIKNLTQINEGHSGECGNFAIALNKLLNNIGTYYVIIDDYFFEDGFYHVALKINDVLYDFEGIQTEEYLMSKYGYDENYPETKFSSYEEDDENMILNKTESGSMATVEEIIVKYKENYK